MKVTNLDERIHVMDANSDVYSIINEIVDSNVQEDAFYVCNVSDIVRKCRIFQSLLPRVIPHYAVKCNDSHIVLKTLAAMGLSFDCASRGEINAVLALGVKPSQIIFANPAKPASHIRHALATGVDLMTFDSEGELHKIKTLYPNARMVLRIRYDDHSAQCKLGIKFGCDPITEAPQLLDIAMALGINVVGVSFHVGSGCRDPPIYKKAIAASRKVFDYAESIGFKFTLLDVGGGYPGDFGTSLDKIANYINEALDIYFPEPEIKVIAEPGRFFVASAYTLCCNIYSIRNIITTDKITGKHSKHVMYFINDGIYGSFNAMLYDHQIFDPLPLKVYNTPKYSSSIWGPTCDGLDQVAADVLLPEMSIGDWMIFHNMGAYTMTVASPFNGFPVPKVHVIADKSTWLLLKDLHPLSEKHFIMGNIPANLKLGLDIDGNDGWALPPLPIKIPICHGETIIQEHILDYVNVTN